jgi:hypothetical protein
MTDIETKPTPGPWITKRGQFGSSVHVIYGPDEFPIAQTVSNSSPEGMERARKGVHEANAHHIVHCVNNFDALVKALRDLTITAECIRRQADNSGKTPYTDWVSACADLDAKRAAAGTALKQAEFVLKQ